MAADLDQTLIRSGNQLFLDSDSVTADALEFWNEIAGLFLEPLNDSEAPPEILADYAVASGEQLRFFQKAAKLAGIVPEMIADGRIVAETLAATQVSESDRMKAAVLMMTLPLSEVEHLQADSHLLQQTPEIVLSATRGVLLSLLPPMIFVRNAFAEYLNKPKFKSTALELMLKLAKDHGVEILAKSNPFVAPALVIAEALKKHEEQRSDDFKIFYKEQKAYLRLGKCVQEGLA